MKVNRDQLEQEAEWEGQIADTPFDNNPPEWKESGKGKLARARATKKLREIRDLIQKSGRVYRGTIQQRPK